MSAFDEHCQPDEVAYPPYITTTEQKRRWDLCVEAAEGLFADLDDGERRTQVWSATRALYTSDMPTGDESEGNMP